MNRVLTLDDHQKLQPIIKQMAELEPGIMSRKFPNAVFQQAWIFDWVCRNIPKTSPVLIIGGYEDPIGPCLQVLGYTVTITDPATNGQDMAAVYRECMGNNTKWPLIISCSVLEHTENPREFLLQMGEILEEGGVGILTCDFSVGWEPGHPKPGPDAQMFSNESLRALVKALEEVGCYPTTTPVWENAPEPYFSFEAATYSFATLTFRKGRT